MAISLRCPDSFGLITPQMEEFQVQGGVEAKLLGYNKQLKRLRKTVCALRSVLLMTGCKTNEAPAQDIEAEH